jgi:transcriptional regulator with XRE-family HTH domain
MLKDRLKSRRNELRLTLEELAAAIGVTRQTVQKYESGVIPNIPSDKIELLATTLETTPAYLMGWDEPKESSIEITEQDKEIIKMVRRLTPDREKMFLDLLKDLSGKK